MRAQTMTLPYITHLSIIAVDSIDVYMGIISNISTLRGAAQNS